jgi:Flp pilus assembly protein TadD
MGGGLARRRSMNLPKRSSQDEVKPSGGTEQWPIGGVFAGVLVALLFVYLPSLRGDFLWDDAGHVTSPALQSWSGLWRIWFEPGTTQQYYPLLHTAFWLEHRVWGDASVGYRLVNVLWHAISACLLIAVLRRLAVPGATFAGLLFALHPVCVESVAWIAEQKNTLSTLFYLAAALAWLRFEDERSTRRYVVASAWFVAALLTKTVTATLPAALLVVAWWRRGRISWRADARPLAPWFVLGIAAGLFTAWFERTGIGAQGADFALGSVERGLLAGRIVWFYLGKLVWPTELAFFYPRWEIDAGVWWQWLFPLAALGAIGAAAWWSRRNRAPLAVVLLFGGTLFPALGFVNVYPFVFSFVADHFQYLASLSVFAGLGAVGAWAVRSVRDGAKPWVSWSVAAIVLVVLGALARAQSRHYVDVVTLYRASLENSPESWVAHHNLASELAARGDRSEALFHAERAVALKPDFAEALNNLADNLVHVGRAHEALALLERASSLQPRFAEAANTTGIALAQLGRVDEAIERFRKAIEFQPSLVEAHFNLGFTLAGRGAFSDAIPHFREAVRLQPEHASAEMHWGIALALTRRMAEARPHFARALRLEPKSADMRQIYGRVLASMGELDAAVLQWYDALHLDPTLPGLQGELAGALRRLGRVDEARQVEAMAVGGG